MDYLGNSLDRLGVDGPLFDIRNPMSTNPQARKIPAIARVWKGRTLREHADEYEIYNYEVGIKPLIEKALGVQTFREDRAFETEFVTISYWESVESMSALTGR